MRKTKTLLFFLATLAIVIIPSCKKETNNVSTKPTLSLTKTEYLPGEIALIQASGSFSTIDTFTADLDGATVKVFTTDSNRLFFIVPIKASGSYVLNMNSVEFENQQMALTIGNYTAITDVEAELVQIKVDANKRVTELEGFKTMGLNISDQNMNELKVMNTAFEDAYTGLSKTEKEELVYFMKNNQLFSEPLPAISFTDSFYRRNLLDDDPSDELWKQGVSFAKKMVDLAFKVGVLSQLVFYPEGIVSKTLALGMAIAVVVNVVQLNGIVDKIGDLIAIATSFEFSGVKQFVKNKTTAIIDRISFKNLRNSDKGQGENLDMIIEQTEEYQSKWDKLKAVMQKIKSWFSNVPEQLSGSASQLKSTIKNQVFKARHSYLSVGNVNNNRIQVKTVDENGERKLQVNSDLTEKTSFQFDITYEHPDLGNSITKTIIAEYDPETGLFTDPRDGQTYKTVQIGNQTWFAENLRYTGSIPYVADDNQWDTLDKLQSASAWCNYDNRAANGDIYGNLYNWYAVSTGNICPAGWHVPSDAECNILIDYLGGDGVAAGKLKNNVGWYNNGTNTSGFSGLPGGYRSSNGPFRYGGEFGFWWSSSVSNTDEAWFFVLRNDNSGVDVNDGHKKGGFSVRCLKD